MIEITLPYPPSVNRYYRHIVMGKSARTLISRDGRAYREMVGRIIAEAQHTGLPYTRDLCIVVEVYPPDRRQRDLDNILKSLLDSLETAGVMVNDSQVAELHLVRRAVRKGGAVVVVVHEQ